VNVFFHECSDRRLHSARGENVSDEVTTPTVDLFVANVSLVLSITGARDKAKTWKISSKNGVAVYRISRLKKLEVEV